MHPTVSTKPCRRSSHKKATMKRNCVYDYTGLSLTSLRPNTQTPPVILNSCLCCKCSVQSLHSTPHHHLFLSASLKTAAGDICNDNPNPALSCIVAMAAVTGVCEPLGAGVLLRVTVALRLCAMWLCTR